MKIVQIITRMDDVGGAQVHVRDIVGGLKESGHDIYIITGEKRNVHTSIEQNDITLIYCKHLIRNLNIISDIKAVLKIRKLVKEISPDIIATHSSKAGIIGRIAGYTLRIPTIFTAHGWSYTEGVSAKKRRIYILIEKLIGQFSDGVIAVSEYDKQLALKHKVLPERKLETIHNGVHDIGIIKQVKDPDKQLNMIMVARFAPPKQQLQLLKVLNQMQHIQWNISFAGEGPALQEAKDYVKSVGLEKRVSFLGNREDVTDLLHKSDLFVLISDWEGLPLSVLEAMRCGLPIIASDVGGVKEAVIHSENGYLIPKSDGDELLKKLTHLLMDQSLCFDMGKKSRQLYEKKFTYVKMYSETFNYYEKTIQEKQISMMQTSR